MQLAKELLLQPRMADFFVGCYYLLCPGICWISFPTAYNREAVASRIT